LFSASSKQIKILPLFRLFIDSRKITQDVLDYLKPNLCSAIGMCVEIYPYESVVDYVEKLANDPEAKIWVSILTKIITL